MAGCIQIVLPGLFDLPLAEFDQGFLRERLPSLNRLLRLATRKPGATHGIDHILREALGLGSPIEGVGAGLPLAGAHALPGEERSERLLLLQAVHLRPDLHRAIILPIQKSVENLADINILINDLKDIFKVDFDLRKLADGLYLLHLRDFDAPTHNPHLLTVLGKPANPYIEQARSILRWYRLLNEMQMYLHQHEVNQRRMQHGLLPINSLWCWGAGSPPAAVAYTGAWYCNDPLLNRFAESIGLRPAALADFSRGSGRDGAVVVDLRLLEALKTDPSAALEGLLLELERELFAPAIDLARRTRLRLRLRAGHDFDFEYGPAAGLRFWRRERNLYDWRADDLAD